MGHRENPPTTVGWLLGIAMIPLGVRLVVIILCLSTSYATGAEYFVNPTHAQASDANPGTENLP